MGKSPAVWPLKSCLKCSWTVHPVAIFGMDFFNPLQPNDLTAWEHLDITKQTWFDCFHEARRRRSLSSLFEISNSETERCNKFTTFSERHSTPFMPRIQPDKVAKLCVLEVPSQLVFKWCSNNAYWPTFGARHKRQTRAWKKRSNVEGWSLWMALIGIQDREHITFVWRTWRSSSESVWWKQLLLAFTSLQIPWVTQRPHLLATMLSSSKNNHPQRILSRLVTYARIHLRILERNPLQAIPSTTRR